MQIHGKMSSKWQQNTLGMKMTCLFLQLLKNINKDYECSIFSLFPRRFYIVLSSDLRCIEILLEPLRL